MKCIVVSNRKGGSAKTTTAVSLASELAKDNAVLLIDFDTQGHATLGVGANISENNGAHSIFLGRNLSETFLHSVSENLTVSPALSFFDVYEYSDLRGVLKNRFKKEKIADFFDYVIIDTAPTFDALLKNALEVADTIVIPFVPHHLGVVAVNQMVRAIYQSSAKREVAEVYMLPVMFNPHINEHQDSVKKVKDAYGDEKVMAPIGVDIKLASQFESATPLVLDSKRSKGQKDYKKFTMDLVKRIR